MEYPRPNKPKLFKRPRRPPFSLRYPRLFYYGVIGVSMLVLFSRPIYDIIFNPGFIDPYSVDRETLHRIVHEGYIPPEYRKNGEKKTDE